MIVNQTSGEIKRSGHRVVDSLYNYTKNQEDYKMTILEFGANNCINCKRMKKVLDEIPNKYSGQVNVVFYDILKPEDLNFMKLFGIASIPSQVLLNPT
jgi:thioredoxin 1